MAVELEGVQEKVLQEMGLPSPDADGLFSPDSYGILPLDLRVRFQGEVTDKNKPFLLALDRLVRVIDQGFDETPEPAGGDRLFSVKFTKDRVAGFQRGYVNFLSLLVKEDPSIVIAHPMYGAYTILDQLRKQGVDEDKLIPVWIGGTVGNVTGRAEVRRELDERLLDERKTVVFADDVGDSLVTLAQFAYARHLKRRGEAGPDERFTGLVSEMIALKDQRVSFEDGKCRALYIVLSDLLQEEKVIFAPLYSKNVPASDAIRLLADEIYKKNESQIALFQLKAYEWEIPIGEYEWIMGGQGYADYPMLDTGISAVKKQNEDDPVLLDFIPKKFHELLIGLGFEDIELRLGAGIRRLIVFNPDGNKTLYRQLVEYVAGWITLYLENRESFKI